MKALPLNLGMNSKNQFKSLLKSTVSAIFDVLSALLSTSSVLLRKGLEILTYFVIYNNLPNKDCNCLLVHSSVLAHEVHSFRISVTFSGGMGTVNCSVSMSTPRHVTLVAS